MPEQDVALEVYYDGSWHDLVVDDDVLVEQPITIVRGQGDESAALRPTQITARLANDDDRYRTSNPESPLYGKAGRNTPVRVKVGDSIRGTAEASSWRAGQSRDFRTELFGQRGKAWVELEAGGLLQRVNQWSNPIQAAMYRWATRRSDLAGYWPGNDGDASTQIANVVPGGSPGVAAAGGFKLDTTFGVQDAPLGSAASFQIGTESAIVAKTPRITTGAWTQMFAFRLTKAVTSSTFMPVLLMDSEGSTGITVYVNNTQFRLIVSTASNPLAVDQTGPIADGWVLMAVSLTNSGGTTSVRWSWYTQRGAVTTVNDSFSSSPVIPDDWRINANTNNAQAEFAEIMLLATSSLFSVIDDALPGAFDGHAGERAAYRFARLMGEEGIPYYSTGGYAQSTPMGPQRPDTLPNLIKEIQASEDALVFDLRTLAALLFVCREDRYRQTPRVVLTPTDLPALPDEVTDDLDVHNVVTASNRDGVEVVARDDTGPLGTQAPPDGVGEYRQTVDVNADDPADSVPQLANWWLRRGTVNLPRYPQLAINLGVLPPDLLADVEALEIGEVVEIAGFREYTVRLIAIGSREVIGQHSRWITFTCVPDQQFVVGEWDAGDSRWDSRSTALKAAVSLNSTSATFRTTDVNDLWSTGGVPYDVIIAGQRSTVTAMGAASFVSGAYDQAATLRRGVDGIAKELAAGEPVSVATSGRWAL